MQTKLTHNRGGVAALLALFTALLPLGSSAAFSLGDGQIDLSGTVTGEYNTDIVSNSSEVHDYTWQLTPEIQYLHHTGLVSLDLDTGVLFEIYSRNTQYNSDNPYAKMLLKWDQDGGKEDFTLDASYGKYTSPNPYVNNITQSDVAHVNAIFSHYLTEKVGYRVHGEFTGTDYLNGIGSASYDSTYVQTYGVDLFYDYSPKLETFLRYNFRDTMLSYDTPGQTDVDSYDNQLLVGVKGDLLTKLTGQVAVGYDQRVFNVGDVRQGGMMVDTSVTWQTTSQTAVTLFANRDFDVSPADQAIKVFTTGLQFREDVSPKIELTEKIFYSNDIYVGGFTEGTQRVDNTDGLEVRLIYKFTDLISGSAYIDYQNVRSTENISTYDQAVYGVSLTAKF